MPIILSPQDAPQLSDLVQVVRDQAANLVQEIVDGHLYKANTPVRGIGSLVHASSAEISFIVSPGYIDQLRHTQACAVAMKPELYETLKQETAQLPYAVVLCAEPYLFYALVAGWFEHVAQPAFVPGIHSSAVIADDAQIDPTAQIGPYVIIGSGTKIGARVRIQAHCVIGARCEIGPDSTLYPNITFYDGVKVGARAVIHASAVLGADGFGFAPNPLKGQGAWGKIAQLGRVLVGDDVEIGAGATIDRGALEDTLIGDGVKLDNQVMVAHNCQIGDHTAIAACTAIAGSTVFGKRCIIGGAAMFSGHLVITDDVQISGGTTVIRHVREPGQYTSIYPLSKHSDWQKNAPVVGQLSSLRRRLRALEKTENQS